VWPVQTLRFGVFAAALAIGFVEPLTHLFRYATHSLIVSYIPLAPLISGYLIFIDRGKLPRMASRGWGGALTCVTAGLCVLAFSWGAHQCGLKLDESESLALSTAGFLVLLAGGAFFFFGPAVMTAVALPVACCALIVPPPPAVLDPVVGFMQNTSAWSAHIFLLLAGTPNNLSGSQLLLDNMAFEVTTKCAGVHAGMALMMVGLAWGRMFLRSGWNRFWLALGSVPVAILRNGFRVFVISEMCSLFGLQEIDSPVHGKGGPYFFAVSLVPLFLLLVALRKKEARAPGAEIRTSDPKGRHAPGSGLTGMV
jgi:exosortase